MGYTSEAAPAAVLSVQMSRRVRIGRVRGPENGKMTALGKSTSDEKGLPALLTVTRTSFVLAVRDDPCL